jgi:hypothetical protein
MNLLEILGHGDKPTTIIKEIVEQEKPFDPKLFIFACKGKEYTFRASNQTTAIRKMNRKLNDNFDKTNYIWFSTDNPNRFVGVANMLNYFN